jgi:hypothetical protein
VSALVSSCEAAADTWGLPWFVEEELWAAIGGRMQYKTRIPADASSRKPDKTTPLPFRRAFRAMTVVSG